MLKQYLHGFYVVLAILLPFSIILIRETTTDALLSNREAALGRKGNRRAGSAKRP